MTCKGKTGSSVILVPDMPFSSSVTHEQPALHQYYSFNLTLTAAQKRK